MTEILTATEVLYRAAGEPPIPGAEPAKGDCWLCGQALTQGIPLAQFIKPTFTDRDKVACPTGTHVCPACAFSFQERSALLALRVGKDKPQRMRNYSHFVVGGTWYPLSKAEKATMRHFLLDERPDLAVIADSGQKHILFRARPGWWQFEETTLFPDAPALREMLSAVDEAYRGFSKQEIATGRYAQNRILRFGVERWQQLEARFRAWRGSALFRLALFLAQREVNDGDGRATS